MAKQDESKPGMAAEIIDPPETELIPFEPMEQEEIKILSLKTDKSLQEALTMVENALILVDKLRDFCIARSKVNDWLETGGNPYFTDAGCQRFRGAAPTAAGMARREILT